MAGKRGLKDFIKHVGTVMEQPRPRWTKNHDLAGIDTHMSFFTA